MLCYYIQCLATGHIREVSAGDFRDVEREHEFNVDPPPPPGWPRPRVSYYRWLLHPGDSRVH